MSSIDKAIAPIILSEEAPDDIRKADDSFWALMLVAVIAAITMGQLHSSDAAVLVCIVSGLALIIKTGLTRRYQAKIGILSRVSVTAIAVAITIGFGLLSVRFLLLTSLSGFCIACSMVIYKKSKDIRPSSEESIPLATGLYWAYQLCALGNLFFYALIIISHIFNSGVESGLAVAIVGLILSQPIYWYEWERTEIIEQEISKLS